MVLLPMKKVEGSKNMLISIFFVKKFLKVKKVLSFHVLPVLKNLPLKCPLRILSLTLLLSSITISTVAYPFALCSPIKANAFTYELSASYSRQFISSQFDAVENWRESSFIYSPSQALSVPMYVSFTCADNYGEELEKWVSIYDSNNRLCYDSGWVTNINSQSVRSPFIGGSTSMHVYLRVRYKGGAVPLTPNMFQGGTFILDVTRREEVTQPYGWNETTTATLPTTVTFPTTSVTAPELEDIPIQVVRHSELFMRLFGIILSEGDLIWIVGASLILAFSIWLLYGK